MRAVGVLTAALVLLVAGCTAPEPSRAAPKCTGVRLAEVGGVRPSYVHRRIAAFPNRSAMCRAIWLPRADRGFVPQGLALDGDTAWVTGYRYAGPGHHQLCQVAHVTLTGRPMGFVPRLSGPVGNRDPVRCRHGGGAALDARGLWVAGTRHLWLLAPERVGLFDDPVLRVWRLARPVRGSFLVQGSDNRLGVAAFYTARPSRVYWYDESEILARGRTALVASRKTRVRGFARRELVRPVTVQTAPIRAQGGAVLEDPRPAYTSSVSRCGMLWLPDGRRFGLMPGAEELERQGRLVWVVSEAGARRYQRVNRPVVPMLSAFDLDQLLHGRGETCGW